MKAVLKASAVSGVVMGLGDAVRQGIQQRKAEKFELDVASVSRFSLIGATFHGPYFLFAFKQVDRYCPPMRSQLGTAMAKTFLTQISVYPIFLTGFMVYLGVLEGLKIGEIYEKKKAAWLETFMYGFLFWPPANVVNFSLIPTTSRAYYVAGMGTVWNTIVSWVNDKSQ